MYATKSETTVRLEAALAALAERLPGRFGVVIRYLELDQEARFAPDDLFPTASVIKLPIMVEVFRQAEAGIFSLDDPLPQVKEEITAGSGVLQFMHPGLGLTVADAVELMIIVSDNTATNLLLRLVGKDAVNATMQALGLHQTRSAGPIGRPNAPDRLPLLSRTTPGETAALLTALARGKLVSGDASRRMREILRRQVYDDMLPRYLPLHADPTETPRPRVIVEHKTGASTGVRADAGIITVRIGEEMRTIVAAAFTADVEDEDLWTAENIASRTVAEVGRLAYDGLLQLTRGNS